MSDSLTEQQRRFALNYVAGPPNLAGNGKQSYLAAYDCKESAAAQGASRLMTNPRVRAYMRELRREAEDAAKDRLRSWWQLAPEAQDVLLRAARGEYTADDDGGRNRVEAAKHILDRAMGSIRHQHEHNVQRQTIVALVAGEPHAVQDDQVRRAELPDDARRMLEASSREEPVPEGEEDRDLADWFEEEPAQV